MKLLRVTATTLVITCLVSSVVLRAQDTIKPFVLDSVYFTFDSSIFFGSFRSDHAFDYVYHLSDEEDSACYEKNKALINQLPTTENHEAYFELACSLWDLEMTTAAEKMFLNIARSQAKYYTDIYYHSSDIPGDTTTNIYGYGSYTSSYKNSACLHLCKIYIEQKKYGKALAYLNLAIKKYKVSYSCGTGSYGQQQYYKSLYSHCYTGLKRYKDVFDLLLPQCLDGYDERLVKAIRNLYSENAIQAYMTRAEGSLKCELDTFPSFSYSTSNYGTEEEKTDTITYYSGRAFVNLFGKKVELPYPILENNERVTKGYFEKVFRESSFYKTLRRLE